MIGGDAAGQENITGTGVQYASDVQCGVAASQRTHRYGIAAVERYHGQSVGVDWRRATIDRQARPTGLDYIGTNVAG